METNVLLFSVMVALIAYLIGSVSFAIIVSRLGAKDDVRRHGSGNAGMTNILRNYGKKMAFFTALGDFGKGLVAVELGRLIFQMLGIHQFDGGYIAGLFVVLGHLFPLYFGFRGGKGVLTSLGVVLILNPLACLIVAGILVPAVFIIKIVSLAVIIGYSIYPVVTLLVDAFVRGMRGASLIFDLVFSCALCLLGAFMHRENIKRLRSGTEYRFGKNPAKQTSPLQEGDKGNG